ncbi:hypothetical protein GCM10010358_24310 [Streptomyces minutiscleroticus]|uniref:Membrane protein SCJ1.26 n=1 Tax=Streptomyces minutiscleroticus TaxID=68238 RepID=A0A918KMR8_9ACTN|nr:hypothetical protein [Streptomyces minutiscleroticus]GGX69078.1 hypothetical protein GCM10010358_24310 [Streptomyces minutiscleroticus]
MATTSRTVQRRVWLWRWRNNPLRRRSDRAEAWVILCAWLFAPLAGVFAGQTTAGAVGHDLTERRARVSAVRAVLTENAVTTPQTAPGYTESVAWATVRWTAADGSPHTGPAKVEPGTKTGAQVTVWADRADKLVSRPLTASQARWEAALFGALAGSGTAGGVLVGGRVVRIRLDRQRMARWDREWEQVGPRWRRTTG